MNTSDYNVQIKYKTGEMTVNLYTFLDVKTINDMKKLIKLAEENNSLHALCTAAKNILNAIISRANQDESFWYNTVVYIGNMINDDIIDKQYAQIKIESIQKMIQKSIKQNKRMLHKVIKLINELQKIMPLDDLTKLRQKQTIAEKTVAKSEIGVL